MSYETTSGYDWMEPNPSLEVPLPYLPADLFSEGGLCHWMSESSYQTEDMLAGAEALYRQQFPNLYTQVELMAAARVTANLLEDKEVLENTMRHYFRGATMAVVALDVVSEEGEMVDLEDSYIERFEALTMPDLKHWLSVMQVFSKKHTEQLMGFIAKEYADQRIEPDYHINAMLIGAQHAYAVFANARGGRLREQEIAWDEHQAYRPFDYEIDD